MVLLCGWYAYPVSFDVELPGMVTFESRLFYRHFEFWWSNPYLENDQ